MRTEHILNKYSISVIIPTRNAGEKLPTLLNAIRAQSFKCTEVLIIDSESSDSTLANAELANARIFSVLAKEFDHGGTRTIAAQNVKGEILVFLTQDAVLSDLSAIARLVAAFENPKVGAAYGRQIPHPDADVFGRALRFFNYSDKSYIRSFEDRNTYGIKTPFLSNSFAAYSRKALQEIGGFKNGLILGEDTYAGAKMLMAGYSIAYVADAVVEHSHNYTALQELKRYFDIGVFHRDEHWILDEFGRAEGEGLRFIFSSLKFLKNNEALLRVPEFFWRTALKYGGYKLGSHYNLLPRWLARGLSMHPNWWK